MRPYCTADGQIVNDIHMLQAYSAIGRGRRVMDYNKDDVICCEDADVCESLVRLGYAEYYEGEESPRHARINEEKALETATTNPTLETAATDKVLRTATNETPLETAAAKVKPPKKSKKDAE